MAANSIWPEVGVMGAGDQAHLRAFLDSTTERATLGLLYGRRRIGKSTLLVRPARAAYGGRAADATLLLFGPSADRELARLADQRPDVEVVDLDRLYHGS